MRRDGRVRRLPLPGQRLPPLLLFLTPPGLGLALLQRRLPPAGLRALAFLDLALLPRLVLPAPRLILPAPRLGLALLLPLPVGGRLLALALQFLLASRFLLPAAEFLLLSPLPLGALPLLRPPPRVDVAQRLDARLRVE